MDEGPFDREGLTDVQEISVTTKASYKNMVVAMQERFEPQSKRDLYLAEFQIRL